MPDITQLVMNHPYFIYFTSSYFTPKALQQSSQCLLLPENLIRICAQQCRKHTELKKLNAEIPDKWGCDASREIKTWSCVFLSSLLFFPSLHPCSGCMASCSLCTSNQSSWRQGQRRRLLTVPWSISNEKSSISMGRLCWAGHGAFADVLEQPISAVLNQKAPQDCYMVL